MPGVPHITGTQVGAPFCKGEGYLQRACNNSPAFAYDLLAARQLVSEGVIEVEEGVERMDHAGGLSPRIESNLRQCLGRIAAKTCPLNHEI